MKGDRPTKPRITPTGNGEAWIILAILLAPIALIVLIVWGIYELFTGGLEK